MRWIASLLGIFASSVAAGWLWAPDEREGIVLCKGGAESPLAVAIVAVDVSHTAAGASLRLKVTHDNHFAGAASVRHVFELVDDRGAAAAAPLDSGVLTLAAGGHEETVYATPFGLAQGYYQFRATSAAVEGAHATAQIVPLYLKVAGGDVTPIEQEQYDAESRAHEGVRL